MTPLVVNILTFVGVFLGICAVNAVLVDVGENSRKRLKDRMNEQTRVRQRERARNEDLSKIAADMRLESGERRSLIESIRVLLIQADIGWTPLRLLLYSVALGVVPSVALLAVLPIPLLGVSVGLACAMMPTMHVLIRRKKRMAKLREQIPDSFELMARVVRAGQTVTQAMRAVADEFDAPISTEFLYCYEQMNLGLSTESALRELARRTSLLELKIFALAVVVHRQTGGNIAELFDKLGFIVRERFRIRGMIDSLTAQGRMQGAILLSLPPVMFVVLVIISPTYEWQLLQYPMMIMAALGMMAVGAMWIRRIVNFDF